MVSRRNLSLLVLLLSSVILLGQGVDERAKNKAENKANSRIDNKVDQGLDKGLDAIEGLFKKKDKKKKGENDPSLDSEETKSSSEPVGSAEESEDEDQRTDERSPSSMGKSKQQNEQANPYIGMFGGMFQEVDWNDSYTFDLLSEATVTTTSKKGKTEVNHMNMYTGEDAWSMRLEDEKKNAQQGFVIFDLKNRAMITLTDENGEKSGMALSMDMSGAQVGNMGDDAWDFTPVKDYQEGFSFERTGNSKTIAGYRCDEYAVTSDEGYGTYWLTDDLKFDTWRFYGMLSEEDEADMPEDFPQGYMMEMNFTDSKSGEKSHYIVTRLDEDANKTLDTKEYNVMDMKSMMEEGGRR